MGEKGKETKERIKLDAKKLFTEKGYKDVSMQDICNATGLSKGGLYRHFRNKADVLLALVNDEKQITVYEDIAARLPAIEILDKFLNEYYRNMLYGKNTLAYALYEYAASEENCVMNGESSQDRAIWEALINYGIKRGEFNQINPVIVMDTFLYAYRGVRMWSRVLTMNQDVYSNIIKSVKMLLIKNNKGDSDHEGTNNT